VTQPVWNRRCAKIRNWFEPVPRVSPILIPPYIAPRFFITSLPTASRVTTRKTPKNAVEIAQTLLKAGAEADALADLYGGHYTTMIMLVSSCHPAKAGVQVTLVDTLLDFGAALEARGSAKWGSPLMTALSFGYLGAAEALVRRGARVDNLAAAAGLGRLADATQLLATADPESRHRALALAAQHGHVEITRLLIDDGEDPSRYNPDGNHSHSTPLHQAVLAGHDLVVRLLVERGARLDIKDSIYQGTPLGWAIYSGQAEIEKYLRGRGATIDGSSTAHER
jgi:ankyrin repeat protein